MGSVDVFRFEHKELRMQKIFITPEQSRATRDSWSSVNNCTNLINLLSVSGFQDYKLFIFCYNPRLVIRG